MNCTTAVHSWESSEQQEKQSLGKWECAGRLQVNATAVTHRDGTVMSRERRGEKDQEKKS